jgi:hypothetical protein
MCDGTGQCLVRTGYGNTYESSDCQHNCQPLECPNYKLCKQRFPKWVGDCCQNRCVNCDIIWGDRNLVFLSVTEDCPVCLEFKSEHIKFPNCEHSVCISCFKKLNYSYDSKEEEEEEGEEGEEEEEDNFTDNEDEDFIDNEETIVNRNCVVCRAIPPIPNWRRKSNTARF